MLSKDKIPLEQSNAWIYIAIENNHIVAKINLPIRSTLLVAAAIATSIGSPELLKILLQLLGAN